ncbi:MarR family winged helix-turn-helix transcriptional regulator [Isoptericola sp. F-RaC21]|uniref:MarR family winged helix-turn-helix transcriptional regulator n=1 Tax=Isoptericola sp. F-RaC21 TaxID=3141452 RepID=UPI00315BBD28
MSTTTDPVSDDGKPTDAPDAPSPLGWSLAALLREWSARVAAACADVPHGGRGYEVLAAVTHDAPPTQAALAARLGIDRTVMTYLLDELAGCGLVERRPDPADRRARRIVPTEHGLAVLADLDARVRTAEDELLAGLDDAERDALRHLLTRAATGAAPGDDRCAVVARVVDPA